jgi:hypothetical protein
VKHAIPDVDQARTKPSGTYVTIRSRDDLDPNSSEIDVQHSGRSVTAVPENVGLCQVVDIGPDVTNVKPGDICFIDFYDVAQGYLVAGEEMYLTQAMALRMTLDLETEPVTFPNGVVDVNPKTGRPKLRVKRCEISPLPGYCLTKHAPTRMTVAVTGNDRMILPRSMTTSGIVGGRNSDGDPCTYVCYEELVKITPGAIQQERYMEAWDGSRRDTYFEERRLKAHIQRLESLIRSLHSEEQASRLLGIMAIDAGCRPGDLVVFCSEFSIQFRALGETYRCVPYKNILAVVDDAAILDDWNRTNPPPPLVDIISNGAQSLYGIQAA